MPNQMPYFNQMGMPFMPNIDMYQNKINELEQRINILEQKIKKLESTLPNNQNYDYQTSMNMM